MEEGGKRAERKGNNYICVHLHKKSIMGLEKKEGEEGLNPSSSFLLLLFLFLFLEKRERVIGTPHAENGKKKSFFSFSWLHLRESVVCLLLSLLAKTITLQKAIIREDTKHFQLKPSLSP